MEASALTYASRRGLLGRRSTLLRLQSDERLVELIRDEHDRAFEVLFDRYQARLFAFCRHMLPSDQDAEDVIQDVFVSAHRAMLGDDRHISVRPWLYRIARNRCLNHLRRRTADGQDTMDEFVHGVGTSTAEHVHNREEFRALLHDVRHLPETQRTALLMREVDALAYTEIAQAMGTTVPAVKSLLVRARVTLAEASQARLLTCGEVRLHLAEAAEGLRKVGGPVRHHVRNCDDCTDFREQLHSSTKALASLVPLGPLAALKAFLVAKLGFGAGSGGGAGAAGGAGGAAAGGSCAASGGAALAGGGGGGGALSSALGGIAGGSASGLGGALTGAVGAKAATGLATAALLTAGAVEVKRYVSDGREQTPTPLTREEVSSAHHQAAAPQSQVPQAVLHTPRPAAEPKAQAATAEPAPPAPVTQPASEPTAESAATAETSSEPAPAEEPSGTAVEEETEEETLPTAGSSSTIVEEGESPFVTETEAPAGGVPPEGPPPGSTTGSTSGTSSGSGSTSSGSTSSGTNSSGSSSSTDTTTTDGSTQTTTTSDPIAELSSPPPVPVS